MRASIVCYDRPLYDTHSGIYKWLTGLDLVFSNFVVAPLIVCFWSSTWFALSNIKFTGDEFVNLVILTCFGFLLIIVFTALQSHIQILFHEYTRNKVLYLVGSRFYTEIFGIASVSSWFGMWKVVDFLIGTKVETTLVVVAVTYVGLLCTKTLRNIVASPVVLITDKRQGYFDVPTLFQWAFHWKKNKILYVLDSVFSVFIVGTLVILVWRGAWNLLDYVIFPGESTYTLSGWTSLGIGYGIIFFSFAVQRPVKMLIRKYHGWRRLIVIDVYVVLSFCGTINIWRGIWILLEMFAGLETSITNCVILHFLSFFVLVIFNSSNTLLVRGVYVDAEENGEDCVEFPCYYFRLKFQELQKKKALHDLNTMEITKSADENPQTEDLLPENGIRIKIVENKKAEAGPANGDIEESHELQTVDEEN